MGRYDYYNDWDYPRSIPRPAKGGIKAQTKRGDFGENWWAQHWIELVESFDVEGRLTRGRRYARSGQVLSIDISEGLIHAKVQGSRARPYTVEIEVSILSAHEWSLVMDALSEQALFVAKLLSGEMPDEIESAFASAGVSLMPETESDISSECSCPDWSNPCKHIAAVYYLVSEAFDRDPFLIFKLRGMDRETFVARLQESLPQSMEQQNVPAEPLPVELNGFWRCGRIPEDYLGDVSIPPVSSALPKRLGSVPFWQGEISLLEAVEPAYQKASVDGLGIVMRSAENGATVEEI